LVRLANRSSDESEGYVLVGDVGGTNCRLALAGRRSTGAIELHHSKRFAVSEHAHFNDVVAAYLEAVDVKPKAGCFAFAGPKFDDEIRMTNLNWIVSEEELRTKFDLNTALVLNDFVAMAKGATVIPDDAFDVIISGALDYNNPVTVLGPGTGMGLSCIVPSRPLRIIPTEGGHVAFAPANDLEREVLAYWSSRIPFVSAETLISTAPGIVGAAELNETSVARDTVNHFCSMLGGFAGNAAVTQGAAGGVVIGGGVSRHIAKFIAGSEFVSRFKNRGGGSWYVENIPVRLIQLSEPLNPAPKVETSAYETIGAITTTRADLIDPSTPIEKLGGDYGWSEGPVWVSALDALLFTDVPKNTIWKFKAGEGITEFLSPSGATPPLADYTSSPGANGLIMLGDDHILLPDHGNRALYKMNVHTKDKALIIDRFKGKRFNSPNDAVLESQHGHLFFTDPPYGLKGQDESSAKELDFNGVYILRDTGEVELVVEDLTRPNGVILSPDEKTLYVANSDPEAALWMAYDVSSDDFTLRNPREILNVTADVKAGMPGLPDGMAMAEDGTIFATGPGGVLILSPEGEKLGLIETGTAIANVTFGGADGRDLYMTSHKFLARTRTKVKGYGF